MSNTVEAPPASKLPLMMMARKEPNMTTDWNVSVHMTALMPPALQ